MQGWLQLAGQIPDEFIAAVDPLGGLTPEAARRTLAACVAWWLTLLSAGLLWAVLRRVLMLLRGQRCVADQASMTRPIARALAAIALCTPALGLALLREHGWWSQLVWQISLAAALAHLAVQAWRVELAWVEVRTQTAVLRHRTSPWQLQWLRVPLAQRLATERAPAPFRQHFGGMGAAVAWLAEASQSVGVESQAPGESHR